MKVFLYLVLVLCLFSNLAHAWQDRGQSQSSSRYRDNRSSIQVTVPYNPNAVIRADRDFIRFDLMPKVQNELSISGIQNNIYDFKIRSVILHAKSQNGQGQVRLCTYHHPITPRSSCLLIFQQYLANQPTSFENPNSWDTYPLFVGNSRHNLDFPIDVEFYGRVRVNSITLVLEPIYQVSVPPWDNSVVYPQVPNFLLGTNIIHNSGQVIIGQPSTLEKNLIRPATNVIFANINYVFYNYRWLTISSSHNDSVINHIYVNCLDSRGYNASFSAENSRGILIENILIQNGDSLTFPVHRNCSYIQRVNVSGYSPNARGSRARIHMALN